MTTEETSQQLKKLRAQRRRLEDDSPDSPQPESRLPQSGKKPPEKAEKDIRKARKAKRKAGL